MRGKECEFKEKKEEIVDVRRRRRGRKGFGGVATQKKRTLPQISNLGLVFFGFFLVFFRFFSVFPFWPILTG